MLQTLKKAFFAVLPSLRKAAEDALRDNAQQSQAQTNYDSEQPQTSNAPKPGPGASKSAPSQQQSSQGQGSDYPGDYRGSIDFEYSPSLDGDPDPVRSCGLGFLTKKTILRGKIARSSL